MKSECDHLWFLKSKSVRSLLLCQLYFYIFLTVSLLLLIILWLLYIVERIELHLPMVPHVVLPCHMQRTKIMLFSVVYLKLGLDWFQHIQIAPHFFWMERYRLIEHSLNFIIFFSPLDLVQVY